MTPAELTATIAELSAARAELERFELAALSLLRVPSLHPAKGILFAAKESMAATRLVCMEAADVVRGMCVVCGFDEAGSQHISRDNPNWHQFSMGQRGESKSERTSG